MRREAKQGEPRFGYFIFFTSFICLMLQVIPTKKFRGFGMAKYLKDHMNVDWKEEEDNKMQKLFNL